MALCIPLFACLHVRMFACSYTNFTYHLLLDIVHEISYTNHIEELTLLIDLRLHFSCTVYYTMASAGKVKCDEFNGTTDVKVFLTKVEIVASIKGYEGEKKAQFLASKLLEPAFDIYMRLSDDDRKSFARIKEELLKEFEKGQLNREEAIHLLSSRQRQPEESAQTFAYKLLELVKLSYPTFPIDQQKTIAKDYFTRGVHPDMQIALKSWTMFKDSNINALAT